MIIGVIQISGIAQIAVLATIEIAYTITVFVIRPFDTRANMNIYLVLMSFMRFISIMLSIAFVSSLGTHFETKSWIAYIIVALNLVVIIAYFLFPALYHIFELVILYKKNGRLSARPTQVYGHSKLARRRYEEIADNPSQSQSPLLSKEHKADPNISTSNFEGHARKAHEVKVNLTINTNFSNNGFSAVSPSSSTPGTPAEATTLTPSNFTMNKQMNIAHNGFYRPPRHRTSYDRVSPGYHSSQSPIYKKVDEKYSRNNDNEEFDFFNDEKKKKPDKKTKEEVKDPLGRVNVNYAIRESDLYYKPAGLFDDDVIENNSKVSHLNGGKRGNAVAVNDSANDVGSDRTTNIPNDDDISNQSLLNNAALHRKSTTLSTDYDTYQSVISLDTLTEKKVDNVGKSQRVGKKQGFFTSIQGWVSLNIKAPSRTTQNANSENPVDDLSPRGFEVLHRGPIKAMPQTEAGNVIAKNT
ncbi:hypothetical protein NADFUDRAFT_83688 [Nadsonia fulvescens var. elongata DSM 6958]|uniref:TRP C-terminal domain-containing protein n=1 Tax=Nadsonia fulvescens var. elongata DSM 6958 TaxID=857566 RepID=A0A1E3PHC9_9ASCO|nr:hypothetical protein NADFUDRAFT_83688 [Nadsonia fulvescens var. elongata DSM 6958]